jgi:hypothetical protein
MARSRATSDRGASSDLCAFALIAKMAALLLSVLGITTTSPRRWAQRM